MGDVEIGWEAVGAVAAVLAIAVPSVVSVYKALQRPRLRIHTYRKPDPFMVSDQILAIQLGVSLRNLGKAPARGWAATFTLIDGTQSRLGIPHRGYERRDGRYQVYVGAASGSDEILRNGVRDLPEMELELLLSDAPVHVEYELVADRAKASRGTIVFDADHMVMG